MKKLILAGLVSLASMTQVLAAEIEVKMLNSGKEGSMVFEPAVVKAQEGDTIKFVPTDSGHSVSSVYVPEGTQSWEGEIGKEVTITVNKAGTYVYKCTPHTVMGMVGLVKVGDDPVSDKAKEAAGELAKTFVMNKDRMEKYLAEADKADESKEAKKESDKKSADQS